MADVTYQRPVKATLMVQLADGTSWEAKPEDLSKFGLVETREAYIRFRDSLAQILRDAGLIEAPNELTDCQLNPMRVLVELCLSYGDDEMFKDEFNDPENSDTWRKVAEMERTLRATPEAPAAPTSKD